MAGMIKTSAVFLAAFLANSLSLAQEPRLKLRLAVAPIDWTYADQWNIPAGFRQAIYEKLVKKLLDTGRFTVLEREALDALLQEQGIAAENTGQSQRGKLVPAQALVKGNITDFTVAARGGGAGVDLGPVRVGGSAREAKVGINVRIFDVDTGELTFSETATGTAGAGGVSLGLNIGSTYSNFEAFENSPLGKATTTAIDKSVELILAKMAKEKWSAKVADFDPGTKEVAINAGSDAGVREGDTFDVVRVVRVIRDPDTGAVIGRRTERLGAVRVVSVEKKISFARMVEGDTAQVGDVVTLAGE
jgi:curli biogenesis system outer membrane secretion channel CsgG